MGQKKNSHIYSQKSNNIIQFFEPYISNTLIGSNSILDIERIIDFFPPYLTNYLGFECRLDNNGIVNSDQGISLGVSSRKSDRSKFYEFLNSNNLPISRNDQHRWDSITSLVYSWQDNKSPLFYKSHGFWLEFDVPLNKKRISLPSIFFGPVNISNRNGTDEQEFSWLITDIISRLNGKDISNELKSNIMNSLKYIPNNVSIFQIGMMLSRSDKGVRFVFKGLKENDLFNFLKNQNYIHNVENQIKIFSELFTLVSRINVTLDITPMGIGSIVGMEASYSQNNFQNEIRWKRVLDYLVNIGQCSVIKRDALLRYLGLDMVNCNSKNYHEKQISKAYVRFIGHIKLVFEGDQILKTKAYLGLKNFDIPLNLHYQ